MFKTQLVRDWMTSPALVTSPKHSIASAQEFMKDKKVRRLAVVDQHNHLAGIITIGDIREALPSDATTLSIWEIKYLIDQLTVEKVMTREVVTIKEDDCITDAVKLMLDHKISGLPVVTIDGTLVGMITEVDIFRMILKSDTDPKMVVAR